MKIGIVGRAVRLFIMNLALTGLSNMEYPPLRTCGPRLDVQMIHSTVRLVGCARTELVGDDDFTSADTNVRPPFAVLHLVGV